MKHDLRAYGKLGFIFILSITGATYIDANEILKGVVASPGVAALIGALYQLARDQAAFEKQLHIQEKHMQFTLGAASHMANIAFDKHVVFCEKYMEEIHKAVSTLFREAETPEALNHAGNFHELRKEYAVWLTDEINENLGTFEDALRQLGAHAHFIERTVGNEKYAEQRSLRIEKNHELFDVILGLKEHEEMNEDYAVEAIKKKVRSILGVEELTKLRVHLVTKASEIVENTEQETRGVSGLTP